CASRCPSPAADRVHRRLPRPKKEARGETPGPHVISLGTVGPTHHCGAPIYFLERGPSRGPLRSPVDRLPSAPPSIRTTRSRRYGLRCATLRLRHDRRRHVTLRCGTTHLTRASTSLLRNAATTLCETGTGDACAGGTPAPGR